MRTIRYVYVGKPTEKRMKKLIILCSLFVASALQSGHAQTTTAFLERFKTFTDEVAARKEITEKEFDELDVKYERFKEEYGKYKPQMTNKEIRKYNSYKAKYDKRKAGVQMKKVGKKVDKVAKKVGEKIKETGAAVSGYVEGVLDKNKDGEKDDKEKAKQ